MNKKSHFWESRDVTVSHIRTMLKVGTFFDRGEDITLLFACESGSRAWGFHSPDSDYDIRIIYHRDLDYYLSIQNRSDTISRKVVSDSYTLDVSGWDVGKFLFLAKKGNAAAYEWLYRCPVYDWNEQWVATARAVLRDYIDPVQLAYHYIGMAKNHWRRYVHGRQVVPPKKYLYLLRAILNASWYLDQARNRKKDLAPIEFDILADSAGLPHHIYSELHWMVEDKKNGREQKEELASPALNNFIEFSLENLIVTEKMKQKQLRTPGYLPLDKFFMRTVMQEFASA